MHKAVEAKLGVGLSRTLLAVDALAAGDLVMPFGRGLVQSANYHLVYSSLIGRRKDVQLFREWILAEAQSSAARLEEIATAQGAPQPTAAVERRCKRR
jgi:LysR family glycine cleavage system transcriptional activator